MNVHCSLFIETRAKRERRGETWNGIVQCMHVGLDMHFIV